MLAGDIPHVIIIDEPPLMLRQQAEVSFSGKMLPSDPYVAVRGASLCSPSVDALRILTCVLRTIGPKVYSFLMESLAGYHEEHDTSEASVEEVQLYGKTDSVLHWKRRVLGARVCE
ncbi:hypothetical protein EDD18DRAFT_1351781 [Armillaria luteobubalina]|uniref:Uncharacterized protein n=1 Tax=Armillaria luteobubalina TaxID=153913 RepID=A0AA39UPL9_9AGAR|nr:hypothetical protein EDD18DRAFT_1351781 [Armillaria luteobubalina]